MKGRVHNLFPSVQRPLWRQKRPQSVPELYWRVLNDKLPPEEANPLTLLRIALGPLWLAHRGDVLPAWILRSPGTRPSSWWTVEAPRLTADDCQPRKQLGGSGERMAGDSRTALGIPTHWLRVDPSDPPIYEAQASYLQRHGLLLPGEAKRLRASHFKPERLPRTWWPTDEEQ